MYIASRQLNGRKVVACGGLWWLEAGGNMFLTNIPPDRASISAQLHPLHTSWNRCKGHPHRWRMYHLSLLRISQTARFNNDIKTHLEALSPGRARSLSASKDEQFLNNFHGMKTKRLSNLFMKGVTFNDELLDDDTLHGICEAAMRKEGPPGPSNDYWLSVAQLIAVGPGAEAQMPHADGAQWWPFFELRNRQLANTMMLNFPVAMSDTTTENGATRIVPDSHLIEYANEDILGTERSVEDARDSVLQAWSTKHAVAVPLRAGDCLLVGGGLVHFGGHKAKIDQERRVLSIAVVNSAFTPEEANAVLVSEKCANAMSERARKFVGRSQMLIMPAGSLGIWNRWT